MVLDLRLLADSYSGAAADAMPPVIDIKLAAAFIAGLFANRQYAKNCQYKNLLYRREITRLT